MAITHALQGREHGLGCRLWSGIGQRRHLAGLDEVESADLLALRMLLGHAVQLLGQLALVRQRQAVHFLDAECGRLLRVLRAQPAELD